MSIGGNYAPQRNNGDGSTRLFSFTWPFLALSAISVSLYDTVNKVLIAPAPVLNGGGTYDFTATATLNSTTGEYSNGSITFNTAPLASYQVIIARVTSQTQQNVFPANGKLPGPTIEATADNLEMQIQENSDKVGRAIAAPLSDAPLAMIVPGLAARANRAASYDANGLPAVSASTMFQIDQLVTLGIGNLVNYVPLSPTGGAFINGYLGAGFARTDHQMAIVGQVGMHCGWYTQCPDPTEESTWTHLHTTSDGVLVQTASINTRLVSGAASLGASYNSALILATVSATGGEPCNEILFGNNSAYYLAGPQAGATKLWDQPPAQNWGRNLGFYMADGGAIFGNTGLDLTNPANYKHTSGGFLCETMGGPARFSSTAGGPAWEFAGSAVDATQTAYNRNASALVTGTIVAGTWILKTGIDPGTEALRVDPNQNLLLGTTTGSQHRLFKSASGGPAVILSNPSAVNGFGIEIDCASPSGTGFDVLTGYVNTAAAPAKVFQVRGDGNTYNANNIFGAISDVKLKQDIAPATSQWDDVKALGGLVSKYRLKTDPTGPLQLGLIAQEARQVSPGVVTAMRDTRKFDRQVRVDGKPVFQDDGETPLMEQVVEDLGSETLHIHYSIIHVKALKALSEAMARIEALETQVKALMVAP